jgi:hypothetical protein
VGTTTCPSGASTPTSCGRGRREAKGYTADKGAIARVPRATMIVYEEDSVGNQKGKEARVAKPRVLA